MNISSTSYDSVIIPFLNFLCFDRALCRPIFHKIWSYPVLGRMPRYLYGAPSPLVSLHSACVCRLVCTHEHFIYHTDNRTENAAEGRVVPYDRLVVRRIARYAVPQSALFPAHI